jgi:hypothetical protein
LSSLSNHRIPIESLKVGNYLEEYHERRAFLKFPLHPSRQLPASRRCDSARWFGRACVSVIQRERWAYSGFRSNPAIGPQCSYILALRSSYTVEWLSGIVFRSWVSGGRLADRCITMPAMTNAEPSTPEIIRPLAPGLIFPLTLRQRTKKLSQRR